MAVEEASRERVMEDVVEEAPKVEEAEVGVQRDSEGGVNEDQ